MVSVHGVRNAAVCVSSADTSLLLKGARGIGPCLGRLVTVLALLGTMPAVGYGFQTPSAGSASVAFGSGGGLGATAGIVGGPSFERSSQGEGQPDRGATDRGFLMPTPEGALLTPQQIVRKALEQEKRWSQELEEDLEGTRTRSASPDLDEPRPARRLRDRIVERRETRSAEGTRLRNLMSRVRAHRLFRQSQLGIGSSLREKVWDNPRRTLRDLDVALKKARKLRDSAAEVMALGDLGKANLLLGGFPVAENYFQQILAMEKERQNLDGQGGALDHIAAARNAAGRTREALNASREALELFRKTKNRTGQATVLNNMALTFRTQDDYRNAVESLNSALLADDTQDNARSLRLMNLAELHIAYAHYEPAKKALNEALEIQKKTGDVQAQVLTLMSLSDMAVTEGLGEKAVEPLVQALDVLNQAVQPSQTVQKKIGDLWLSLGQPDKARSFVEQSGSQSSWGRYHLATKALPQAEQSFRMLLESCRESRNPDDAFVAHTGLGLAAERRGDLKRAEGDFEDGVKAVEDIRSGMLPAERKNFYAAVVDGFPRVEAAKGLVRVRMKLKKPDQTVSVGEITRAREFADNICRRTDITNLKVPQEVLDRDAELQNVVASLELARAIMPRHRDRERYDSLSKDLDKARAELKAFVSVLWEKHRDYAAARHPRPVDLKDASIGKDEHVVTFDALGEGVGIKLLKGNRVVKAVYVPWNAEDLERDIRAFRKSFETVKLASFNVVLAEELYRKLLAPVLEGVPQGTILTLIPDGVLALLPFEALVTGGSVKWKKAAWGEYPSGLEYVGDRYPIVYYQSLTALTLARGFAPRDLGNRMLVVADPVFQMQDGRAAGAKGMKVAKEGQEFVVSLMNAVQTEEGGRFRLQRLTETAQLATYLQKLYPDSTDLLMGLQASKDAFLNKVGPNMPSYGRLVLATHGLASNTLPGMMEPALALSMVPEGTDGFLTMTEVMGLNAHADVVALTACQSGLGRLLPGEGVMSLGRAFQVAGAKTVVMSLWSVSEEGSVKLMEHFFTHLQAGVPKLEAWTRARSDLRAQGYDHPFFWAPFIMVGGSD
jgi:CHAT domain-containing protein